jgi:Tol biopolymer transport system component
MSRLLPGLAILALSAQPPVQPPAQTPRPDTDVFLSTLAPGQGAPRVDAPVNVSKHTGYDNQPAFTPDGLSVLFTTVRDGSQSDIHRYDIATGRIVPVTKTPESEYSPTVTPDGRHLSVVRVEADGTQRLWRFTLAGAEPTLVLEAIKPVGYHAWIDEHTLVLFVLGRPSTLQVADTRTGQARTVASDIGRSLHRIPGRRTASFLQRPQAGQSGAPAGAPVVMEVDPASGSATRLIEAVPGATDADCAWTPDGWLLMASGSVIHGWRLGTPAAWTRIADLAASGVRDITRLAVSPKGDRLALVAVGSSPR